MREITRYRIDPPRSISRHSRREYEYPNRKIIATIVLDRTCDAIPRFFTAYLVQPGVNFPPCIPIGGENNWGEGFSWKRAEALLAKAVQRDA